MIINIMDQNTEIIIFVLIFGGIGFLLLVIYMLPKKYNYVEERKKDDASENDLKIILNQRLSNSFTNTYKQKDADTISIIKLQPSIDSMVDCFSKKLIEYYKSKNIYSISDIIRDIKNNNIPYNFNKDQCKNSIIAGLDYKINQLGSSFNFNNIITQLLSSDASKIGFNTDSIVYDSNIISSTGDINMYNFSNEQLDYLNKIK